jgi:hypothetical protein
MTKSISVGEAADGSRYFYHHCVQFRKRTLRASHHSSPGAGGGFAPAWSDVELITTEICGEYFKLHKDCDLYDYFAAHYRHFFPRLPNRSLFVRQAANLWHVKTAIWQLLLQRSGQGASPVQVIDTLPLPVCTYTRAQRDRCFKTISRLRALCREEAGLLRLQTRLASLSRRHDDYALPIALGTCP